MAVCLFSITEMSARVDGMDGAEGCGKVGRAGVLPSAALANPKPTTHPPTHPPDPQPPSMYAQKWGPVRRGPCTPHN